VTLGRRVKRSVRRNGDDERGAVNYADAVTAADFFSAAFRAACRSRHAATPSRLHVAQMRLCVMVSGVQRWPCEQWSLILRGIVLSFLLMVMVMMMVAVADCRTTLGLVPWYAAIALAERETTKLLDVRPAR
jgi:hypothetical protein